MSGAQFALERVEHCLKMIAEAQANELPCDTCRQRKEDRAFSKRIARDTSLIRRWKGGESFRLRRSAGAHAEGTEREERWEIVTES